MPNPDAGDRLTTPDRWATTLRRERPAVCEWLTVGSIDFAHLHLRPSRLNNVGFVKFDRDQALVTLDEQVGFKDVLLSQTLRERLTQVEAGGPSLSRHHFSRASPVTFPSRRRTPIRT